MCGKSSAKCFLIGFNIIFVILGGLVLAAGVVVYMDSDGSIGVLARVPVGDTTAKDAVDGKSMVEHASIGMMAVGGFIFLIAVFGFVGACMEWRIFLVLYAIILLILFIVLLGLGIVAFVFRGKVDDKLMGFLEDTIKDEYKKGFRFSGGSIKLSDEPIELAWDLAQVNFECCGARYHSDWLKASKFDRTYTVSFAGQTFSINNAVVPASCCRMVDRDKYPDNLDEIRFVDLQQCLQSPNSTTANLGGCYESVKDEIKKYSLYIGIAGLVTAFIELLGIVCACVLCNRIGKE